MPVSRRTFLLGLAAAGAAACTASGPDDTGSTSSSAPLGAQPSSATGGTGPTIAGTPSTTEASGLPPLPTRGQPARFIDRGPQGTDKVALTFHTDGDLRLAQRLLDTAADHGAAFTSFVVGNWMAANPSWAKKLLDGGHELANHTTTHPTFAGLSRTKMLEEIGRCRDILAEFAGHSGSYFRPSGTDDGRARPSDTILGAAGEAGYPTVLGWDVEPFDYRDPGANAVRTRVLDSIAGGSIVSLHFGHQGTADALDGILEGLAAKGLRAVTVTDLLTG